MEWTSWNGQAIGKEEKMSRYIDSEPDNAGEEYALMIGRIEAITAYIVHHGQIEKKLFFAMMGLEEMEE